MDSTDFTFSTLKRALQAFQSKRLENTYADFGQDPQYQPIGEFFFKRLYGPEDFSFRDASIRKLHAGLGHILHKRIISAVGRVIDLHDLSDRLDNQMTQTLAQMGVSPGELDLPAYTLAYRKMENETERMTQIQLSVRCIRDFYRLSQMWVIGVSLKTVRSAARLLGMGRIMDFINQGYQAFKTIRDIEPFVRVVEQREIAWHGRLMGKDSPDASHGA